jgi:hypothetical protein
MFFKIFWMEMGIRISYTKPDHSERRSWDMLKAKHSDNSNTRSDQPSGHGLGTMTDEASLGGNALQPRPETLPPPPPPGNTPKEKPGRAHTFVQNH